MMAVRMIFVVPALLLLVETGCDGPVPPAGAPISAGASAPPPPPAASSAEFQQLLDTSVTELQAKNDANKSWGLGSFDQWDLDQDVGDIVFTKDDGTKVTGHYRVIKRR